MAYRPKGERVLAFVHRGDRTDEVDIPPILPEICRGLASQRWGAAYAYIIAGHSSEDGVEGLIFAHNHRLGHHPGWIASCELFGPTREDRCRDLQDTYKPDLVVLLDEDAYFSDPRHNTLAISYGHPPLPGSISSQDESANWWPSSVIFRSDSTKKGPVIAQCLVKMGEATLDELMETIHVRTELFYLQTLEQVLDRDIGWDGHDPASLTRPADFKPVIMYETPTRVFLSRS